MHIKQFLTNQGIWFDVIKLRPAFTSRCTSKVLHLDTAEVAKSILLCADGDYLLALVPGMSTVDVTAVKRLLQSDDVALVSGFQQKRVFPDCEVGSVPVFGSEYGMKTIVDESLAEGDEIVVEGNAHSEAIRIRYSDFVRLERPLVARIAQR